MHTTLNKYCGFTFSSLGDYTDTERVLDRVKKKPLQTFLLSVHLFMTATLTDTRWRQIPVVNITSFNRCHSRLIKMNMYSLPSQGIPGCPPGLEYLTQVSTNVYHSLDIYKLSGCRGFFRKLYIKHKNNTF